MGVKLLCLALFGGFLAYYLYNPLPENLEQPALFCLVNGVFRIIEDLSKVSEALGYKEVLVFRRDALGFLHWVFHPPTPPDIKTTDTKFNGVPVRIYKPASLQDDADLSPGLVYVHGGGYVMGTVDLVDTKMWRIVRETGVIIVNIEYRLAPEHPSPAAVNDCDAAVRHLFANAERYGVDRSRIGIGGDSAGGNMASTLSLKYRDMGKSSPRFSYQVLIYPWLQGLDFNLPSYVHNEPYNRPDMQRHGMILYTLAYLNIPRSQASKVIQDKHVRQVTKDKYRPKMSLKSAYNSDDIKEQTRSSAVNEELATLMEPRMTNSYNFPLMADTVAGVPPALVLTMGLDSLRDEGLMFLERLREAGVKTQHYHDDKCWHASFNFSDGPFRFECGARLVNAVIKYINQAKDFVSDTE